MSKRGGVAVMDTTVYNNKINETLADGGHYVSPLFDPLTTCVNLIPCYPMVCKIIG